MDKKVTIYDIANKVNFSASTVSRVLSNSKRTVNPEIRKIVEEAARKMNYYPNTMARNLKKNNNCTIGVVLPSIANPYYPSIVRGMEDEAILKDYSINICSCDREKEKIDMYFERLIENRVSGIITIYLDELPKAVENYINRGGKVLTIGTKEQSFPSCGAMYFDKEYEAYIATKHLLELGHRHVALFLSSINNHIRVEKLNGYKKALKEYGIEYNQQYLFINDSSDTNLEDLDSVPDCNTGIHCAEKLLKASNNVTGIVCMNDLVALGCISVLKRHGLHIPNDYSIIGFDDTFFSNLIEPQITTLKINKYQLGQQAIKIMFEMLNNEDYSLNKDFSDTVKLVIRNSTAHPPTILT